MRFAAGEHKAADKIMSLIPVWWYEWMLAQHSTRQYRQPRPLDKNISSEACCKCMCLSGLAPVVDNCGIVSV